ncbi:MAG: hypothetical protein ABSE77_06350 [Acidimicrobiales bacterium]
MSHYEEPVLASDTDGEVGQRGTTVPDRSVVARTDVSPKPVGLWGVRAWVWEFRVPVEQGTDGLPRHDLIVDVRNGGMEDGRDSSSQRSEVFICDWAQ